MTKVASWILTVAIALLPTWALAEDAQPTPSKAVALSDADLDKVHAGAFTLLILENPGNASSQGLVKNHFGCINQCGAPVDHGASGLLIVVTPSGNVIQHCVGRCL